MATLAHPPIVTTQTRIVALFALAMLINYADRGSLSVVAPKLSGDLGISNATLGLLLSAFFWVYAPAQIVAGWCAQAFPIRWVMAGGFALWSLATLLTGFVQGLALLFALRLLLGLGESVIFPCIARHLAESSAEAVRGRANGWVSTAIALGPMVGTFVGGLILAHFGWRSVFISFGIVSLLWLVPWLSTPQPRPVAAAVRRGKSGPGYAAIIRQRAAWGASVGHFCNNYSHYLLLTWLPSYLVKGEGFSVATMATIGATIYAAMAAGSFGGGQFSDLLILRGLSGNRARKIVVVCGAAGTGLAMEAVAFAHGWAAVPLLMAGGFSLGLVSPMLYTIGQTLSGPQAGSRWMGLQNFVGNLAGIVAPIVTGIIVDRTGSYMWAFVTAAGICGIGLICWGFVIERVAPIDWETSRIQ